MLVSPHHDDEDIERQLLAYAEGYAISVGARVLQAVVEPDNGRAITFYREQGFAQAGRDPLELVLPQSSDRAKWPRPARPVRTIPLVLQCLVLNASFEPLNVCSVRRAHVLVFKGKAEVIEQSIGLSARRRRSSPGRT